MEDNSRNILYEDRNFRVEYNPVSHEDHILYVTKNGEEQGVHIPRGVLEEVARTKGLDNIERKLNTLNPSLKWVTEHDGLTMPDVALALTQARLKEVENERDSFISEYRKLREA